MQLYLFVIFAFFLFWVILSDRSDGGGGDFVAGFLLGGALCGTLAYIFAPQVKQPIHP